tara:strand:- start:100 stop:330 length:231 start_codon:yes stop_codon:yes gene_type:complete
MAEYPRVGTGPGQQTGAGNNRDMNVHSFHPDFPAAITFTAIKLVVSITITMDKFGDCISNWQFNLKTRDRLGLLAS